MEHEVLLRVYGGMQHASSIQFGHKFMQVEQSSSEMFCHFLLLHGGKGGQEGEIRSRE